MIANSHNITLFNIEKIKEGVADYCGYSMGFSYSGVSFRLSKKILDILKDKVDEKNFRSLLAYELCSTILYTLSGYKGTEKEYNDDLLEHNLKNGELYQTSIYAAMHSFIKIFRGAYPDAYKLMQKQSEIGNVYEYDLSVMRKYNNNTFLLLRFRKLRDALSEANEGIDFAGKKGFTLDLFSQHNMKAYIQLMMGDIEAAGKTLEHSNEIRSKINAAPAVVCAALAIHFLYSLSRLEESIKTGNKSEIAKHRKRALKAGKMSVSSSKIDVFWQIEIYNRMGIYYWLINKQRKALKWWNKSIKTGEHLEARLELSRTYREVGKRLLEPKSRYESLNDIKAKDYLEKARAMFEDMDLQVDLDELDRIVSAI